MATKSDATLSVDKHNLRWFREHYKNHSVSPLDRDDAIALFAFGRDEGLNHKTVNRRVIVMPRAITLADLYVPAEASARAERTWPRLRRQVESP
jgi:hypothetical protein